MNELSLFSGYGGFNLGFQLAGLKVRTVGYVEWEKYPQEIIKARIKDGYLDDAPIFADIRSFDGTQYRGLVDIVTAGFPCQPHSVAGQRKGEADERNLWPDTARVINEVGPRYVLLENVPGILHGDAGRPPYGGTVVGELSEMGYDCQWAVVGARDAGAPHKRERWWCLGVAHSESEGRQRRGIREPWFNTQSEASVFGRGCARDGELADSNYEGLEGVRPDDHPQGWQEPYVPFGLPRGAFPAWPPGPSDRDGWARVLAERPELAPALTKEAESEFRGVAHGNPHRVDRLKALGNGICSPVVREFLTRI